MKQRSPDSGDPLDGLLREWVLDTSPAPRFEEHVWSKIARVEEDTSAPGWVARVAGWFQAFNRPAVAAAYLLVLISLGSAAGAWSAQNERHRVERELSERYVQTLDPQLMAAAHP